MQYLTEFVNQHENSVLIAAIVFLAAITLYGHYRGLIRMAVSFASAIISLMLVKWLLPYVTGAARSSAFFQKQTEKITENLFLGGETTDYSALYRALGLDRAAEATGEYLAGIILNVICFIILFVLVNLLFKVAAHFLSLVAELPLLHGANQVCGAVVGFLEGVFYLWIFMIAIAFTPTAQFSLAVTEQILNNPFLLWIYQNNFLLNILAGIFGLS